MASITLTGTLLDPTGEVAVGDQIRFTHQTTTGETIQFARSVLIIPPNGLYNITLEFGLILVEYLDIKDVNYKSLGVVTVNQDSTATDLPGLLNAIVPPTDAQLLLFQGILADTEAARDIALLAAAQQTTLELIASTTTHPNSTVLTLSGHTLPGDGGGGKWQLNGVVGQTVSQSPTQLADFLLNDANGNQWALVDGVVLAFNGVQYLPLPFGATGNGNYAYNNNDFDKIVDPDRLNPATLAIWQADTSAQAGDAVDVKERTAGKGGGFPGDVVTVGTTVFVDLPDTFGVIESIANPGVALVVRVRNIINVDTFGALDGPASFNTTAVQAAYNFAALRIVGCVEWSASSYSLDGPIFSATGIKTDFCQASITTTGAGISFASGTVSGNAIIENASGALTCDRCSFENGNIFNTDGIAFKVTNFRFGSYIKDIVANDVSQLVVGKNCFFSDYEKLIYFGVSDFVDGTADTLLGSANITVTNAEAATLSAGMEFVSHFAPVETTIVSVGAADSAGAGFANVILSELAESTANAGAANTGWAAALNPKAMYEFDTANSDLTFNKCSGASRFIGFDLGQVNSTTFTSCDVENNAIGWRMRDSSSNNVWLSPHVENCRGWIWDFSQNTGGGYSVLQGSVYFLTAGVVTAGKVGFLEGMVILPESLVGYTPFGFTGSGNPVINLKSPNAKTYVIGGGPDAASSNLISKSIFTGQSGTTFPGPFGYVTGTGATVTQITSRVTAVTINNICGTITTDTTILAPGAAAAFPVFNNKVAANDSVIVSIKSGPSSAFTVANVSATGAGSFNINVINTGGAVAEIGAIQIKFSIIRSSDT
jgi:hypothetical protein